MTDYKKTGKGTRLEDEGFKRRRKIYTCLKDGLEASVAKETKENTCQKRNINILDESEMKRKKTRITEKDEKLYKKNDGKRKQG